MTWKVPEKFRARDGIGVFGNPGDPYGAFRCDSPDKSRVTHTVLTIIASPGMPEEGIDWEHVSVKASKNINGAIKYLIPTWKEMCFVKALFWDTEDWVVQYHPAESDYVNHNASVLHLWRPVNVELPKPPKIAV